MHRWLDEFAAENDGLLPLDVTWQKSAEWDKKHANSAELAERESDGDVIYRAIAYYDSGDFPAAFQIWSELAAQGSVWSMIELGRCFQHGCGVERDIAKADDWYKRAFAGGSQVAMLKCAKAAALRNDYTACEAILEIGVNQDWTPAIFWQAWYRHEQSESTETYRTILPMLRKAAERGHPAARMCLASFMLRGKFGLHRVPLGLLLAIRTAVTDVSNKEKTLSQEYR